MDFELTGDQAVFVHAFERMLADARTVPVGDVSPHIGDVGLERALAAAGFFDPEFVRDVDAVAVLSAIERAAALPLTIEIAHSMFIAPRLCGDALPRSIAIGDPGATGPIRHLPVAGSLIAEIDGAVRVLEIDPARVEPIAGKFAYPLGLLKGADWGAARVLDVAPAEFDRLRRLATAAEALGVMRGAVELTVGYVKERKQFKRPIGSFQVVRHRLSECLTLVLGARDLVLEAGWSEDPVAAALALSYVQSAAARIVYETQQFHGAIGQTLEYPLHLWTYRLRVLQGDLGGPSLNASVAADGIWE